MEVNSWLTGRRGISLPFSDACEPLAQDAASFDALLQAAISHGRKRQWRYLDLRGGRRFLPECPASMQCYTHYIPLQEDECAMFARFAHSNRRAIRKAMEGGLRVEVSRGIEALRSFYAIHCRTRRRHGLPPQPFSFFSQIHRHILSRDEGRVFLAFVEEKPVAGAMFLESGRTALYKFAASDAAHQSLRPNNLLLWRAIQWYARFGFDRIDLGRTSMGNPGLRRFKQSWGATETSHDYFRYNVSAGRFTSAPNPETGWHNRLFRTLPGFVSRLLGNVLYRHVA